MVVAAGAGRVAVVVLLVVVRQLHAASNSLSLGLTACTSRDRRKRRKSWLESG
jgi:hypothetical protein